MRFLQRLLPPLPAVEADATTREAVEERVLVSLGGPVADRAAALLAVRDDILWPASRAWRARCPVDESVLGCEVLLVALSGARVAGFSDVDGLLSALVQSVAFGLRVRFADGPEPILRVAWSLNPEGRDPGPVVVSLTGHRLDLHRRRGGSEGWFLLGTLAWIAGETLAEPQA